jgi:hypothetical protein
MKLRRIIATITLAAVFFWAPSAIPVKAVPAPPCGVPFSSWLTADTAFAIGLIIPCPVTGGSSSAGAAATGGFIGFVAFLAVYDFVRRTTCIGDPLRLGGPGFSEKNASCGKHLATSVQGQRQASLGTKPRETI